MPKTHADMVAAVVAGEVDPAPLVRRSLEGPLVQPTRSAITVAGISGVVASSCRTSDSNDVNDVDTAGRSYCGGRSDANARATVDLPTPKSRAT